MKKIISIIIISSLFIAGVAIAQMGGLGSFQLIKLVENSLHPVNDSWPLGSQDNPWVKVWGTEGDFDKLVVSEELVVPGVVPGGVTITGNADETQLTVTANDTQTNDVVQIDADTITSADALQISAITLTDGTVIKIIIDSDTVTTGKAIDILSGAGHDTSVFNVNEDGEVRCHKIIGL